MCQRPSFAVDLNETGVVALLSEPLVSERVAALIGTSRDLTVTQLSPGAFHINCLTGDFVFRFPRDEQQLSMLRVEERVQVGMRDYVSVQIPDTTVLDDISDCPPFAVHAMIPGRPLTGKEYHSLQPQQRDRLVADLAIFFRQTHVVPLRVACRWLDLSYAGDETADELAAARGKPQWFSPDAVADMRTTLISKLDEAEMEHFRDTVRRFNALEAFPRNMIFGHGDMHGFNMAIGQGELGPRLMGVFDLGCVGILDIHEDFFRLSLISEDLLERVTAMYTGFPGHRRTLDRDRIAIYYRAFLFYLMAEQSGSGLDHLKRLLRQHLEYCSAHL